MFLSKILFFALLNSFPSSASPEDEVKVTFRCPPEARYLSINWDNEMKMYYTEAGAGGDVKLHGGGSDLGAVPFDRASRDGQKITCHYGKGQFVPRASYSYKIKRKVISCFPSEREIICRLEP